MSQVRMRTAEQQKRHEFLLQQFLFAAGDFVMRPPSMMIGEGDRFVKLKNAFLAFNDSLQ